MKKADHFSLHLHHRVAQEALRLRCVRSFCCGALLHPNYTDWAILAPVPICEILRCTCISKNRCMF
jgi:hypothetical protein